jgi:methylenetetrahydrofolate--tRNA-(uracil-5-)-methyltransferase
MTQPIHTIGAALACSEADRKIVHGGIKLILRDSWPVRATDADETDGCARPACSNAFGPQSQRTMPDLRIWLAFDRAV